MAIEVVFQSSIWQAKISIPNSMQVSSTARTSIVARKSWGRVFILVFGKATVTMRVAQECPT